MRVSSIAIAAGVCALGAFPSSARAFEEFSGTTPLGMGGASRAWAAGDAGPLLNPSGMSLGKSYSVEAAYEYASRLADNFFHASIVDGTSAYGLAGGLYYTYHASDPSHAAAAHGHEGGLALSFPFGEALAIGATVKYFKLEDADVFDGHTGGITFDVGATVRPTPIVSLAVVGTNLRDLHDSEATQAIGYGAALLPLPGLLLAADGLTRLTADNATGRKGTSLMIGGNWTAASKLAVRLGGGYDAVTGNGYVTAGVSGTSELGAIDAGVRQDITRREISPGVDEDRETVVGVSVRLFVPTDSTASPPTIE